MTACVNKKHTRRVALAISASLVGALSLGAAATPVFAEGIETQAATSQQAFNSAKVTAAITTNNDDVEFNQDGSMSVVASAEGIRGVYPTEIQAGGQTITLTEQGYEDGDYYIHFYKKGDIHIGDEGYPTRVNGDEQQVTPHAVGTYTGVIFFDEGSDYNGCRMMFDFEITPAEIGDVTVVNEETGGDTFVYDAESHIGEGGDVQLLVDGKKFDEDAFYIEWYRLGDISAGDDKESTRDVTNAGDYAVKLTGKERTIYAGSTDWAYFTVDQLDLAQADVVIEDMTLDELKEAGTDGKDVHPDVTAVNGNDAVCDQLTATFADSPTKTVDEPGEYTFKVAPTDSNNANIINSKEVKFNVVIDMLEPANFLYSEGVLKGAYGIDARRESFNTALIKVLGTDGKPLAKEGYTVTVTDAEGEPVSDTELKRGGTFNLTVSVNASYYDHKIGGKATSTITVINGVVESAKVYFTYNGVVGGDAATDTYDGTNLLDNLKIDVYDDLGIELVAGDDYDVVATDAAGNVVTEAVDAGTYTVTVSSDTYDMADETFTLTVEPVAVTEVRVSNLTAFGEREFYPYTGSDIAVELEYKDADGSWKPLPADTYELVFQYEDELHGGDYSVVESVKEVGYYKVYVHQAEKVKNYEIAKDATKGFIPVSNVWVGENDEGKEEKISGLIEVSDQKVFADVENTFWGAQEIFDAVDLGYMSGYKGTTFFGPLDHLTRAQAAVVLYNMGTGRSVPETSTLHVSWVERGLAFPDAEQWYAAELGWATQVGVVEGYPDGNYGGADEITREQFAIMLRNYAAAKGEDVSVGDVDAALEGVKDADTISDWAREAVAWAVENGVMGAEGYVYAGDPIERAGAAIMVTRYQPQELDKDDYLVGNVK